jgi:hypothetical protein
MMCAGDTWKKYAGPMARYAQNAVTSAALAIAAKTDV